jgi:molecular chaperone GrpE
MTKKKTDQQPTDMPSEDEALLQAQVEELTRALQRERADAMNLRRQYEERIASLRTSVKADTVKQLLPVIDNFERALKHVPAALADDDYVKGVQGIVKQFEKVLETIGVSRIPTVGTDFDPHYHEAISMEEGDGDREVVSEELQPGYSVGKDVIRHAVVRVRNEK